MTTLLAPVQEEIVDRVLAGFVLVDASSGRRIRSAMQVYTPLALPISIWRNQQSTWVISQSTDQSGTIGSPPAAFDLCIRDPNGYFLAQRYKFNLPATRHAGEHPSADLVTQISLFPSVSGRLCAGLSPVRVSVLDTEGHGIPWALVVVQKSDDSNALLSYGLCDERGMSLIGIPCVSAYTTEANSVRLTSAVSLRVQVRCLPWRDALGPSFVDFESASDLPLKSDQIILESGKDVNVRLEQRPM